MVTFQGRNRGIALGQRPGFPRGTRVDVDVVGSQVDQLIAPLVVRTEGQVLFLPDRLQAADGGRPQTPNRLSKQRGQSLIKTVCGHAFEVPPRQHCFKAPGLFSGTAARSVNGSSVPGRNHSGFWATGP